MVNKADLGGPLTHALTTLSGRPLHNLRQTIQAANQYRSIEWVKERKGLTLAIKLTSTTPTPNIVPSQDTDEDGKPIRLRGSGKAPILITDESSYTVVRIPRVIRIHPTFTHNANAVLILHSIPTLDAIVLGSTFSIRLRGAGDPALPGGHGSLIPPPQPNDHSYLLPRRYECPECSMIIWTPTPPIECPRCDFQETEYSHKFQLTTPQNGECMGCGMKGTAGNQCENCGAPIEPSDNTFHFQFGWHHTPRPEPSRTNMNVDTNDHNTPFSPPKDILVTKLLSSLTSILSPPHAPRTIIILKEALMKTNTEKITHLLNLPPTARTIGTAREATSHIASISPRLSRFCDLIILAQPAKVTALLGLMARPNVADILHPSGTEVANKETIAAYINELSSWAQLKVATFGSPHGIPSPFADAATIMVQNAFNISTYDDSPFHDNIITRILNETSGPLKSIILRNELIVRRALRSVDGPTLIGMTKTSWDNSPSDTAKEVAARATLHIAAESRRLLTLRAFVCLSQPAALLAMIITSENIGILERYIDPKGILISNPYNITYLMESYCTRAIKFCASHATFLDDCNVDLDHWSFDNLKRNLLHQHLLQSYPSLFLPRSSEKLPLRHQPPGIFTRDAIKEILGREVNWQPSAWDHSTPPDPITMAETFGQIQWKHADYIFRHYNVCFGNYTQDLSCEHCHFQWPFFFTGKCPACLTPILPIHSNARKIRAINIIRKVGAISMVFSGLLESVRRKHLMPSIQSFNTQDQPLIHVVPVKGYSALFLMRKGEIPDIGFRGIALPQENPLNTAVRILQNETNIQAVATDFVNAPIWDGHPSEITFIFPSMERDIWVSNRDTYIDFEFVCTATLQKLHQIHQTTIYFPSLLQSIEYLLNDPLSNYQLIMAKCPHCRSLGPVSSLCRHQASLQTIKHPITKRIETSVVGFLQGNLMDWQDHPM